MNFFIWYAKISYIVYRVWIRLLLGKNKRNQYFNKHCINWEHFIKMGHKIEMNGIKGIPRKNTDDYIQLFYGREQELIPHLKFFKGETFLDVGANVGYHTLKSATAYGKDIKVIAIEAHPETYKALCRNIACNGFKNIIAINKAVSDKKGIITLYDDIDIDGYLNSGHATLLLEQKSNFKSSKLSNVLSDTLDNILKEHNISSVDVLKMDIEGAEIQALGGSMNTLKKLRKIIVEIHDNNSEPVRSIIQNNDFYIETVGPYVIGYKN